MSEPADLAANPPASPEADVGRLMRELGVSGSTARALAEAGHTSAESIRLLHDDELEKLGVDPADLTRLRAQAEASSTDPPPMPSSSPAKPVHAPVDGQKSVDRWMENVRHSERPKRRVPSTTRGASTEVLKKWVDGDDRAMETWIQSADSGRPTAAPTAPRPLPPKASEVGPTDAERPAGAPASPRSPSGVSEREATVVRWLTDLLDRVKSDQFDPRSLLADVQELHRQLFEERSKRKQHEDELEHVKRGSVAVIKYVRSREAKAREQAIQAKDAEIAELRLKLLSAGIVTSEDGSPAGTEPSATGAPAAPGEGGPANPTAVREVERQLREEYTSREHAFIERETEMRRRIVQLEGEIRNLRVEAQLTQQRATTPLDDRGTTDASRRLKEADARERELILRENELRTKFEEIRIAADELERKRAPLEFKEKELASWETRLTATRQALEIEARRQETEKVEAPTGGAQASQRERELEDIRTEVARKEEDLRARETLLSQKMEELESMTRKAAAFEAEDIRTTAVGEARSTRVRTGVRRLDDLLFGGLPPAAQVLVNGPAHTGKDVLTRLFISEGLRQGSAAIWVVSDKTYTQIREEMTAILPTYPEFEQKGLVRYVDLYSRALGVTQADPTVRLLAPTDKGVVDQLVQAVNVFSQELKEKAPSYRLAFETVSTVTAYLDQTGMFRFLQPFAGRRKLDGAASYFVLETGMHSENDLQSLEHMMDGSVNLKVDQLKTFLSVRGISEVQSRAWVGYTFSKKSFSLGSFSLDHIR
jgi:KaiC/GvpD/RAD55 family RecA-like ATPase